MCRLTVASDTRCVCAMSPYAMPSNCDSRKISRVLAGKVRKVASMTCSVSRISARISGDGTSAAGKCATAAR
ncbi:hypothetical protein G6F46_015826 [Rhizopus delemar]|nr:hypothetical protein G6F46_015826 [Rhizopus delemar]